MNQLKLWNIPVKLKSTLATIIFAGLFLFCIQVNVSYAEEEQFIISLDCYESCNGKKDVNHSKDIMFKLTIQNKLDYWICGANGVDFKITVENANLNDEENKEMYENILGKKFFMKPDSKYEIYIPFNIYNHIKKEDYNSRLDEWKITPELKIKGVEYYKNPFETKETSYNSKQLIIKGNVLKFDVVKPDIENSEDKLGILDKLREPFIFNISTGVIAGLIVLALSGTIGVIYGFFKKKKRR